MNSPWLGRGTQVRVCVSSNTKEKKKKKQFAINDGPIVHQDDM